MSARLSNITFDCHDARALAEFWSQVLGRPLDPGADDGFASIGGADADRSEPAWYFERVPEGKTAKNRVHPDLVDPNPETLERLVALGATVVAEHSMGDGGHRWTVMRDPEGNEFCLAVKSFEG